MLLPFSKPRFPSLSKSAEAGKVRDEPDDDQHKSYWVHPMHRQVKELYANDHTPEIGREQRDVEECSACDSQHEWNQLTEQGKRRGKAYQVHPNLGRPYRRLKGTALQECCLNGTYEHSPESMLANHFVQWALGDEEFFEAVADAVECRAKESKQIPFDSIWKVARARSIDSVRGNEDAHSAHTEQ